MKPAIDKLFQEKLEQHTLPAPEKAWGRIESSLDKGHNKTLWFKIAASLILVAAAFVWLTPFNETRVATIATKAPITPNKKHTVDNQVKSTHESVSVQPISKIKPVLKHEVVKENSAPETAFTEQESIIVQLPTESELITSEQNSIAEIISPVNDNVETAVDPQSTTIVYAATEVNEKYLLSSTEVNATSGAEKTSTFRKLLDKAAGLKNNQNTFGELRQKKNEILALNFKNEKRERNN
jgi:hypothetical protein